MRAIRVERRALLQWKAGELFTTARSIRFLLWTAKEELRPRKTRPKESLRGLRHSIGNIQTRLTSSPTTRRESPIYPISCRDAEALRLQERKPLKHWLPE